MPSKSPEQHKLMEAAAHTPGGYDGVPQSVGKEFVAADDEKPFAAGIIFTTGDRILMTKRADNGLWAFAGGLIEKGESEKNAAIRECYEELGYVADQDNLKNEGSFGGFVAFSQKTDEFLPTLNDENTAYEWALIRDFPGNIPRPTLPEAETILAEFIKPKTELDIARLISTGELPSPQRVGEMWLFNLRITGTGTAYRQKIDEYVYRAPENYLNDEFLARCNGLAVIWEHPESNKLDSEEYANRSIGAVMLPYIKDEEVWGIGRIYDADAASAMIDGNLSTSPSVIFSRILENSNIIINENDNVLIEGIPSIIDHLAICKSGVWDKGGEPSGVIVDNPEAKTDMEKENEEVKADNDIDLPGSDVKEDLSIDEKIKKHVSEAIDKYLAKLGGSEKADDTQDPLKMPDAPMESIADSTEEKDKEDEKSYADSSIKVAELERQIAALQKAIPRARSDAEFDALAAAQFKAEQHYAAFGDSLSKCRPMDGESVIGYRKRMLKGLQKHSAKFGKIDLGSISDEAMLGIVEEGVYADSMAAAHAPVSASGGMPRPIVTEEGGRKRTEYVGGDPLAVFAPFRMTPRQMAAVREQPKH